MPARWLTTASKTDIKPLFKSLFSGTPLTNIPRASKTIPFKPGWCQSPSRVDDGQVRGEGEVIRNSGPFKMAAKPTDDAKRPVERRCCKPSPRV